LQQAEGMRALRKKEEENKRARKLKPHHFRFKAEERVKPPTRKIAAARKRRNPRSEKRKGKRCSLKKKP